MPFFPAKLSIPNATSQQLDFLLDLLVIGLRSQDRVCEHGQSCTTSFNWNCDFPAVKMQLFSFFVPRIDILLDCQAVMQGMVATPGDQSGDHLLASLVAV